MDQFFSDLCNSLLLERQLRFKVASGDGRRRMSWICRRGGLLIAQIRKYVHVQCMSPKHSRSLKRWTHAIQAPSVSESAGKPKMCYCKRLSLYPMVFILRRSFLGPNNCHCSRIVTLTGVTVTDRACTLNHRDHLYKVSHVLVDLGWVDLTLTFVFHHQGCEGT